MPVLLVQGLRFVRRACNRTSPHTEPSRNTHPQQALHNSAFLSSSQLAQKLYTYAFKTQNYSMFLENFLSTVWNAVSLIRFLFHVAIPRSLPAPVPQPPRAPPILEDLHSSHVDETPSQAERLLLSPSILSTWYCCRTSILWDWIFKYLFPSPDRYSLLNSYLYLGFD